MLPIRLSREKQCRDSVSIVKELLENAIDAGATKIELIVEEAGRNLIKVADNGSGMSETDARMAFERHATSKIRTTEDIFISCYQGVSW